MAFISKDIIDEIKSKNRIEDVIGSYIDLNNNKALCPFHNEKTPSFSVSTDKQIFKCFSGNCGKSGNVITFIMEYLHVSFEEALKILADRAGIQLSIDTTKKVNKEDDKYYQINTLSKDYYKNNLLSTEGKEAMSYLLNRGLTKDIIDEFDIGLASSDKLNILLSKKYKEEDLLTLGLVKEYNGNLRDTFVNKIVFPLIDEKGNTLGFSGRKYLKKELDDKEIPKYSNTRETKIFKKSELLYNINNAKTHIISKKEIMIVEGYMDAIRVSSVGYKNVVALMGTSFTKEHLEKIKSYKCKVVLNLDQDDPGVVSTINIGHELLKNGIKDISVIVFDKYKDSDEYINSEGKEAFDLSYNNRLSFIDFELNYLKQNNSMKDSLEISKYINEAIDALENIDDEILRELKINELSKEFEIDVSVIKNKLKKVDKIETKNEEIKEAVSVKKDKYYKSELRILYLMLNYEDVIISFENNLGYLIHKNMSSLAYKIIEFRNEYNYYNISDFLDSIIENETLYNTFKEVMKYEQKDSYTDKELDDYYNTIKEYSIKLRIEKLEIEMKSTLDINKKIEIAQKISNIKKEVSKW